MKIKSMKTSARRLVKTGTLKFFLMVAIGLGLSLTGWPTIHEGTVLSLGGPQSAYGQEQQELIEPYEDSGPIEGIGADGELMTIGDKFYRLSDVARYYRNFTKNEEVSHTLFILGQQVGFTVNQFNEIEEMWLERKE